MQHVDSYPGIYRGVVVDYNDPLSLGRVKMIVPQVFGEQVTDWAWPVGGAISQVNYPYGNWCSTLSQPVTAANTATVAALNKEEDANRVSLHNSSKITVEESGDYFFQFSAQFTKTSGSSAAQADIWLRKNGVDIPRTNSRVTLQGNPNETLVTLNYILDLDSGDYVQVVFSSSDSSVGLVYHPVGTSPTRPELPSIIASINLIGKYKPKAGQAVWAAFEGGDPNFPLWIGAF